MGRLKIFHPELLGQGTRLSTDDAAAATTSTVENNQGFAVNDLTVFGSPGVEKSEIVTLTSVSGNETIGHSAGLKFAHGAQTRIAQIAYNQVEISRATSQSGSYSVVTTTDLTIDEIYTVYNDTSGTSSSWYKIRYKNSVTGAFSDYSPEVQATGYDEDSLFNMTEEVLEDFNDPDAEQVSRLKIRRYLRAAVRKLTLRLIKAMPDYRKARATQALTISDNSYSLPTRFLAFQYAVVSYDSTTESDGYKATFENEADTDPNVTYITSDPRISFRGEEFIIKPTPTSSSGMAFLYYWDYPASMTDDDDTHGLPYGARDLLVSYALWRCWMNKSADTANLYKSEWNDGGDEWIEFVATSRQGYTNKTTEVVFGNDLYED